MQCYTELTPPTAVTHSLRLSFRSADSNDLVVARTSLLQIFTTKHVLTEIDSGYEDTKETFVLGGRIKDEESIQESGRDFMRRQSSDKRRTAKLILVAEYKLSGTVTSLARIKTATSKSGADALLIGFMDAKLSLIEWDPDRHGLSTISIHYYEQEELQESPWAPKIGDCVNYLSADPGSRCAAFKFGMRNLAILPFKQGDEDVNLDEDWDEELDGPRPEKIASSKIVDESAKGTPYLSSFVLRLSALDPNLLHPIHLAFLYEYREPTFGILTSIISPSASLLKERKDILTYMVFTLDVHQRASTTILSVANLPSDLFNVIPLPTPVGGALLVGANEVIHVNQDGKTIGIAVNTFAKQCTSFSLGDQSSLDFRLEGCKIEPLSPEAGDLLMILANGGSAILSFRMDGRSVSGFSIRPLPKGSGISTIASECSTATYIEHGSIFIGSENADSVLLGWKQSGQSVRRSRGGIGDIGDDFLDDEMVDDADDLYGEGQPLTETSKSPANDGTKLNDYVFRQHDTLVNIAPITSTTLGRPFSDSHGEAALEAYSVTTNLELAAAVGKDKAGALAIITQEIQPKVIGRFEFPEAQGIWTMSVKKPLPTGPQMTQEETATNGAFGVDALYDELMIVTKAAAGAAEESAVYALTAAGFESLTGTEFEPAAGPTIEAGTLGNGMRVIQVLRSEVRSYDGDLGLAQILPMFDDDTGAEPKIVSASFADPYLLLMRDDSSVFVAQCDDNNELEELERKDDGLLAIKWLSGCLYKDGTKTFAVDSNDEEHTVGDAVFMFLLSARGALHIYKLPDLSKAIYVAEGIHFVLPILSPTYTARRTAAHEVLTEILVADLGDLVSRSPFLILRSSNDDLTMYEPFHITSTSGQLSSSLHFAKVGNPRLAANPAVAAEEIADNTLRSVDKPLRAISNLGGYSTVFLPGASPSFMIKSAKSSPKVMGLQGHGVRGFSGFHTEGCDRGFVYVDTQGIARVSQLPRDTNFAELGLSLRKVYIGETVHAVSYHPPMQQYVVGTSTDVSFELPKEDDHHCEDSTFKPTVEKGFLKLISPQNWSIIDTIELEPFEMVMCIETFGLEVSESTNERKQLIVVGTAISRGEDLATRGRLCVYDVVTVVPELNRPETDRRLKLIAKEDIPRGAVTAISEIGTQGFMLIAQGQKCMVRGLKEDGTLLPVAFLDMNCYVTSIKELKGTGLCLMADVIKGVWFAGYTEEPYKMQLFGKSGTQMEVTAAELLPDGKELYLIVSDADCNLHIMQYDPEHPKSLQGHQLLHRTTFSLGGHLPSTMTLLPRTKPATILPSTADGMEAAAQATIPGYQVLITSRTGSLALLSPLSEAQYRRLSTLASHVTNALEHACGLNPRAYRISKDAPEGMAGGRTVVDGSILLRWMELGSQRRVEVAGRAGTDAQEIREDISALMGGLAYL